MKWLSDRVSALREGMAGTIAMLVAAALLLAVGTVGGARAAAPPYVSDDYMAELSVSTLGVSLVENGATAGEGLLAGIGGGEQVHPGVRYDEQLSVANTGSVDAYVRVTLRRYWTDAEGAKETTLAPDLIGLELAEGSGWVMDESSSTSERMVLYYTHALAAGQTAPAFADGLTIDAGLGRKVTQTVEDGVVTTTYDYDGVSFNVEAEVDAVQTHNAEAAILSAWGREVSVSGSDISLQG